MSVSSELSESAPMEVSAVVEVANETGLHVRPCNQILKLQQRYASQLFLRKVSADGVPIGREVNGRSATSILLLEATQGTRLLLRAVGPDAAALIQETVGLFESGFEIA